MRYNSYAPERFITHEIGTGDTPIRMLEHIDSGRFYFRSADVMKRTSRNARGVTEPIAKLAAIWPIGRTVKRGGAWFVDVRKLADCACRLSPIKHFDRAAFAACQREIKRGIRAIHQSRVAEEARTIVAAIRIFPARLNGSERPDLYLFILFIWDKRKFLY